MGKAPRPSSYSVQSVFQGMLIKFVRQIGFYEPLLKRENWEECQSQVKQEVAQRLCNIWLCNSPRVDAWCLAQVCKNWLNWISQFMFHLPTKCVALFWSRCRQFLIYLSIFFGGSLNFLSFSIRFLLQSPGNVLESEAPSLENFWSG